MEFLPTCFPTPCCLCMRSSKGEGGNRSWCWGGAGLKAGSPSTVSAVLPAFIIPVPLSETVREGWNRGGCCKAAPDSGDPSGELGPSWTGAAAAEHPLFALVIAGHRQGLLWQQPLASLGCCEQELLAPTVALWRAPLLTNCVVNTNCINYMITQVPTS